MCPESGLSSLAGKVLPVVYAAVAPLNARTFSYGTYVTTTTPSTAHRIRLSTRGSAEPGGSMGRIQHALCEPSPVTGPTVTVVRGLLAGYGPQRAGHGPAMGGPQKLRVNT